jgi:ubiquitin C-terminal hydrolase
MLHNSLSYKIEIEIKGKQKELDLTYFKVWENNHKDNYSIITKLFQGYLINNIECNQCNRNNIVFEPFNSISLSIFNNSCSIYDCLDEFTKTSTIKSWVCEHHKRQKGCNKSMKFMSLPNYFIINLKRHDEQNQKNNNLVNFPLQELDLTKYINKESAVASNNYIYNCYAINYHTGNVNNGHYYSACKNLNGNWYEYNDGDITLIKESQLVNNNAYTLFYYRTFITA